MVAAGKHRLKQTETLLICARVEGLMEEEGFPREAAVRQVMAERGKKRSTVFATLATQKSKK